MSGRTPPSKIQPRGAGRAWPWLALAFTIALFAPAEARAHGNHGRTTRLELGPKRELVPPTGPRGRAALDSARIRLLRDAEGRYVGELTVRNVGDGPLRIHRVGVAPTERWPEAPPGLGVQALERDAPIPPGGARSYQLSWRFEAARTEQLHGTVEVESDGAAPGANRYDPPAQAAVWADRRVGPARYLLSLLVLLPLLLPALALVARALPTLRDRLLRRGALALTALHAAAGAWAFVRFDRTLSRADGNEGLQMIERVRLGAELEWFLGLDGLGASAVAALGLAAFAGVAALDPVPRRGPATFAAAGLLLSSATLCVLTQSVAWLTVSLSLAAVSSVALAAFAGQSSSAARHLAPAAAVSVVAMAIVGHLLAHNSPSTHGELFANLPELVRHGLHVHEGHDTWLGLPVARAIWALSAIAALPLLGVLPFHGWSSALARGTAPGAAAFALASLGTVGGVLLWRVGYVVLPGEAAWGSPALLAFGTASALLLGVAALGDRDPRKLAGRVAVLSASLVLMGLASRTPQGLQAAAMLIAVRALSVPLLVLTAGALERRVGSASDGGVGQSAPKLALVWLVALLATSGLPGGASFWALLSTLAGSVARTPVASALVVLACAVAVVAQLRALRHAYAPPDPSWRASDRLVAHAGRVPDLVRGELAWAVPLAVALVALAVLPRGLSSATDTMVIDAQEPLDPPGPTQIG